MCKVKQREKLDQCSSVVYSEPIIYAILEVGKGVISPKVRLLSIDSLYMTFEEIRPASGRKSPHLQTPTRSTHPSCIRVEIDLEKYGMIPLVSSGYRKQMVK